MSTVVAVFPELPLGRWDLEGERFTTFQPFVYHDSQNAVRVYIGSGFVTDFSSIPRAVWWWFPKTSYPAAGLLHDHLYRHPYAYIHGVRTRLDRGQCDELWRRALHLSGCRKSKRVAAWMGLRAGGWAAWNSYRKAERGA